MSNFEDVVVAPAVNDFEEDFVAPAVNVFNTDINPPVVAQAGFGHDAPNELADEVEAPVDTDCVGEVLADEFGAPAVNNFGDDVVEPAPDIFKEGVVVPAANSFESVCVADKVGASVKANCAKNIKSGDCPKCTSALSPISAEQLREQRDDNFECDVCNEVRKVRSAARGGALICDPCDWGKCGKCVSKSSAKVAHDAALQVAHDAALQVAHDAALAKALHLRADRRSPSPHPRKRSRGSAAASAASPKCWDDGVAQMRNDLRYEASGRLRVVVPMSAALTYARIAGLGQTVTLIAPKAFAVTVATDNKTIREQLFAALAGVELSELIVDLYLGKTKTRKDRAPRADSSQRQLCGVPPNASHHGAFELTNPLTWGHESFSRVAGHAGFWQLCLILAVACAEKQALRAEDVMITAAQNSEYAGKVVNPRTYSPGRKSASEGDGYYVYGLCRFGER